MHIYQNASLLVEPEIMRLPSLGRILKREAKLLQSEENKLVDLTEGNLRGKAKVSERSRRWHLIGKLLTFLPMHVLVPAPKIKLCLFIAAAFSPNHLLGWKVWASGP
jgi:hypothetical protein